MKVTINGEDRELTGELTLDGLVAHLELHGVPLAIELNGDVVPRDRFGGICLKEGDSLEVVTFVGGG